MSDEVIKWSLYTAVPAVLGAIGYGWRRLRIRADLVAFLNALPPDCQGVLGEFVRQKSHTVILPPHQPPVVILEKKGLISKAGSAGTFDAAAYYFTLRPDVYEIVTEETRRPSIGRPDHKHD
jgi:hypothetical protein